MRDILLFILLHVIILQKIEAQQAEEMLDDSFNMAFHYHYINKDSAYYYYEKAIKLANEQDNLDYLLFSYQYLINANGYHYDLKNYQINLHREDSLLHYDKRFDTLTSAQYYKDYLLFDKGNFHYKSKQYVASKKYFQQLLTKINSIPSKNQTKEDIAMLSSLYSFLGLIYKHTGKYELATHSFNKDIALLNNSKDSVDDWESRTYNSKKLLSQVFEEKKEFSKANALLNEVLIFYKTKTNEPRFKNNLLSAYLLLEKNEIKQGNCKQAIKILEENAEIYPNTNPFEREVDLIYGDAYLGLKNYEKAEHYYRQGLVKTKVYRNDEKHQDMATIYARLGNLYLQKQLVNKGLQQFQLALQQLEKGFMGTDLSENPNPKNTFSKIELLRILREKQEALYSAYKSTKNEIFLKNAHQTSKAIIETLDELRPEFESKLDKQFLITETYPSIQKMVTIAYELYATTKNDSYVDDAFFFMEKSKSILLLEAQRNSEATKYGGVPEAVINKAQQFRANISHLEQEVFKSETENNSLTDTLFSLKSNYVQFLASIEKKYPKFYALKYQSNVVSLQTIQEALQKDQALLSYLVTENVLYLTVIDRDTKTLYKLPLDEEIKNTIQKLYRKYSNLDLQDASIYKDSYAIYKAILEPALKNTPATDLIILADDLLHYIPFDALVTSSDKHKYLLASHSISYASSATLLQEQNKVISRKNTNLLVFAPQFTGAPSQNQKRTDMSALLYNELEAKNIAQYFDGKVFNGTEASISNFKNEVSSYNLLHFATHASANDEFPDYSYLAFSKDSTDSNLLYINELYNYTINADLVTLSACQTGIGKLQKGEGMLSLARAFHYAGASAIVTTLWEINDQSTSEIMGNFYKNLDAGLSKKEALRQAKLSYLEANDDRLLNHPYYWSGIVLTGNTMPVTTTNYLRWIILGTVGIAAMGIVFYILFRRKPEYK